jgi:nicotinate-nucleotide pyrophosphorylase (carboxylating)
MTQQTLQSATREARQDRVRQAFFRGSELHLGNPIYLNSVRTLLSELLASDVGSGDLTVAALELADRQTSARILAKEPGVVAGVTELSWFLTEDQLGVAIQKQDGESITAGELILEIQGPRNKLLGYERTGLNFLQRLSGIATATREFQHLVHRDNSETHVIGTRKTPWGLVDKRALHLGGGGTHRLGLWDAILVKNNHLALLADSEHQAVRIAVERAWRGRKSVAFIEVEVRSRESALAAAEEFRRVQESHEGEHCPCALLLDNMAPQKISAIIAELRDRNLLERVLTEASGNISEANISEYARCGVDVISIGALTHSVRALDICQRLQ